MFTENRHLPLDEIIALFEAKTFVTKKVLALDIVKPITPVAPLSFAQHNDSVALFCGKAAKLGYSQLVMGGGERE